MKCALYAEVGNKFRDVCYCWRKHLFDTQIRLVIHWTLFKNIKCMDSIYNHLLSVIYKIYKKPYANTTKPISLSAITGIPLGHVFANIYVICVWISNCIPWHHRRYINYTCPVINLSVAESVIFSVIWIQLRNDARDDECIILNKINHRVRDQLNPPPTPPPPYTHKHTHDKLIALYIVSYGSQTRWITMCYVCLVAVLKCDCKPIFTTVLHLQQPKSFTFAEELKPWEALCVNTRIGM